MTLRLVTSVSVVQRWNQAVTVLYAAKIPTMAASDQHSSTAGPGGTRPDSTNSATATIQPAIAGAKKIQCALVEYSTFSPGCRISSIKRPILALSYSPRLPLCGSFYRSEEHTSELQSQSNLVCRLLLEKKKQTTTA